MNNIQLQAIAILRRYELLTFGSAEEIQLKKDRFKSDIESLLAEIDRPKQRTNSDEHS
jgi:hypothetical protein